MHDTGIYIYTYLYICMCMYIYIYMYTYACVCVRAHVGVCTPTHRYLHTSQVYKALDLEWPLFEVSLLRRHSHEPCHRNSREGTLFWTTSHTCMPIRSHEGRDNETPSTCLCRSLDKLKYLRLAYICICIHMYIYIYICLLLLPRVDAKHGKSARHP